MSKSKDLHIKCEPDFFKRVKIMSAIYQKSISEICIDAIDSYISKLEKIERENNNENTN